jgi:hypothetical protein
MVPTSILGKLKLGGADNTLSPTVYFLAAACAIGLMEYVAFPSHFLHMRTQKLFKLLFIFLVTSLTFGNIPRFRDKTFALQDLPNNYQEMAYRYAKKYPGETYFPEASLATLLAEGKLYHFQFGVTDREDMGTPVSREHFRRYIPTNIRLVAFSRNDQCQCIMKYLPEFSKRVDIEELPGWIVYTQE